MELTWEELLREWDALGKIGEPDPDCLEKGNCADCEWTAKARAKLDAPAA